MATKNALKSAMYSVNECIYIYYFMHTTQIDKPIWGIFCYWDL